MIEYTSKKNLKLVKLLHHHKHEKKLPLGLEASPNFEDANKLQESYNSEHRKISKKVLYNIDYVQQNLDGEQKISPQIVLNSSSHGNKSSGRLFYLEK